ncbi:MAG: hypothetical protein WA771_04055 [Chthoniobacterales bacterium]
MTKHLPTGTRYVLQATTLLALLASGDPLRGNVLETAPLPPAGWADDAWTDPGGWETVDVTKHGLRPDDQTVDSATAVRRIIASGSGNRIFYFPGGTYWFRSDLVISQNGIRIAGSGSTTTHFIQDDAEIAFRSPDVEDEVLSLDSPPGEGETSLRSSDASRLKRGDFILPVAQFPYDGNREVYRRKMEKLGVGQIVIVEDIEGDTVRFRDPLGIGYSPWPDLRIRKLNLLEDVGIESLRIEKLHNDEKSNVKFDHVHNAYARNVRSYKTSKHHVWVSNSYRVFIEGNNFSHSHDYGPRGHGYGVQLVQSSTRCYIVNNKFETLRHAVVIQEGANHSVVAYNHNLSNLLLHGNFAHSNLFEGNQADAGINFDMVHGTNGPHNVVFRNNALGGRRGIRPRLGNDYSATVVGNVTSELRVDAQDFTGANRVRTFTEWGVIPKDTPLPPSLYRSTKPAFLEDRAWPPFGPGTSADWGASLTIPAAERDVENADESAR